MDVRREQSVAQNCPPGAKNTLRDKSRGVVYGQNFKAMEFKTELTEKLLNLRTSVCNINFSASEKQGLRLMIKRQNFTFLACLKGNIMSFFHFAFFV